MVSSTLWAFQIWAPEPRTRKWRLKEKNEISGTHFLNTHDVRCPAGGLKWSISLSLHGPISQMRKRRLSSFTSCCLAGEGWSWDLGPAWSRPRAVLSPLRVPAPFSKDDFRETAGPPAFKENASAVNLRCFYVPKQARLGPRCLPRWCLNTCTS